MTNSIDTPLKRLLLAGLTTAACDFVFSSVLVSVFYKSTVARLWQGVASVPLGPSALDGGARTVVIGLALHVLVAFTWSAVFLVLVMGSSTIRRNLRRPGGVIATVVAYGPLIWLVMSFVLIPTFTHRPPAITFRWWVQFFGHIPAVSLPIVLTIAAGLERTRGDDAARVAAPVAG